MEMLNIKAQPDEVGRFVSAYGWEKAAQYFHPESVHGWIAGLMTQEYIQENILEYQETKRRILTAEKEKLEALKEICDVLLDSPGTEPLATKRLAQILAEEKAARESYNDFYDGFLSQWGFPVGRLKITRYNLMVRGKWKL